MGSICVALFVVLYCEVSQDPSTVLFGNAAEDLFCGKFASSQRLVNTESVAEAVHGTDRSN
jgi:hypothetical protein